mmetsp:Transcript_76161/g.153003  ORF Transcript_76161/g.153003 Transcript_76161/m.153003 type:complete len:208 (-) Transcript_76161:22-645(-)
MRGVVLWGKGLLQNTALLLLRLLPQLPLLVSNEVDPKVDGKARPQCLARRTLEQGGELSVQRLKLLPCIGVVELFPRRQHHYGQPRKQRVQRGRPHDRNSVKNECLPNSVRVDAVSLRANLKRKLCVLPPALLRRQGFVLEIHHTLRRRRQGLGGQQTVWFCARSGRGPPPEPLGVVEVRVHKRSRRRSVFPLLLLAPLATAALLSV